MYLITPDDEKKDKLGTTDTWWVKTLKILFASQGFAIPLMRISEPYFYKIVSNKIKEWCKKDTEKEAEIEKIREVRF